MTLRPMATKDITVWAEMRSLLWPEYDEDHRPALEDYFTGHSRDVAEAFIAEFHGVPAGFIELNVRNFAEGSHASEVPYVEAWFVKPDVRGQGIGRRLMQQAETWSLERGYFELASDADESNQYSIDQHIKQGFVETARVVCFLKPLNTN